MEGKTPVIPPVESALDIAGTNNIAKIQHVFRPAFGSGDLRRGRGMPNTQEAEAELVFRLEGEAFLRG